MLAALNSVLAHHQHVSRALAYQVGQRHCVFQFLRGCGVHRSPHGIVGTEVTWLLSFLAHALAMLNTWDREAIPRLARALAVLVSRSPTIVAGLIESIGRQKSPLGIKRSGRNWMRELYEPLQIASPLDINNLNGYRARHQIKFAEPGLYRFGEYCFLQQGSP